MILEIVMDKTGEILTGLIFVKMISSQQYHQKMYRIWSWNWLSSRHLLRKWWSTAEVGRGDGARVKSSNIWRELGAELPLLGISRSQLRWFGRMIRMPPGHLPLEVFQACPSGRGPSVGPGLLRRITYHGWPGSALWPPGKELVRWRSWIPFLASCHCDRKNSWQLKRRSHMLSGHHFLFHQDDAKPRQHQISLN